MTWKLSQKGTAFRTFEGSRALLSQNTAGKMTAQGKWAAEGSTWATGVAARVHGEPSKRAPSKTARGL